MKKLEKRVFRGSRSPGTSGHGGGARYAGVEGGSPRGSFISKLKKEGELGRSKPIMAMPIGSFFNQGARPRVLNASQAGRDAAPP